MPADRLATHLFRPEVPSPQERRLFERQRAAVARGRTDGQGSVQRVVDRPLGRSFQGYRYGVDVEPAGDRQGRGLRHRLETGTVDPSRGGLPEKNGCASECGIAHIRRQDGDDEEIPALRASVQAVDRQHVFSLDEEVTAVGQVEPRERHGLVIGPCVGRARVPRRLLWRVVRGHPVSVDEGDETVVILYVQHQSRDGPGIGHLKRDAQVDGRRVLVHRLDIHVDQR